MVMYVRLLTIKEVVQRKMRAQIKTMTVKMERNRQIQEVAGRKTKIW